MRPNRRGLQSSVDAAATPYCDTPDTKPEGRRRNVAVVRRGRWNGAQSGTKCACGRAAGRRMRAVARDGGGGALALFALHSPDFFGKEGVDNQETTRLYKPPWRAAASWCVGATWKPLTVYAVNHPAMSCGHVGWCGLRRLPSSFSPCEWGWKEDEDGAARFRDV